MAREARKISKSGNYRVTLKGEELFITKEDKQRFTEILEKNFEGGKVYGCEITKEEIRFVVKESDKGISMCMKPVSISYARYFNRTHDREGKLFSGRFASVPLESEEEIKQALADIKTGAAKKTVSAAAKTAPHSKTKARKPAQTKKTEKADVIKEPEKKAPVSNRNLPSWLL